MFISYCFSVPACSQPVLGQLPCPVEKYKKKLCFFYHFFYYGWPHAPVSLLVPAIQCYPGVQAQCPGPVSRPSAQQPRTQEEGKCLARPGLRTGFRGVLKREVRGAGESWEDKRTGQSTVITVKLSTVKQQFMEYYLCSH